MWPVDMDPRVCAGSGKPRVPRCGLAPRGAAAPSKGVVHDFRRFSNSMTLDETMSSNPRRTEPSARCSIGPKTTSMVWGSARFLSSMTCHASRASSALPVEESGQNELEAPDTPELPHDHIFALGHVLLILAAFSSLATEPAAVRLSDEGFTELEVVSSKIMQLMESPKVM